MIKRIDNVFKIALIITILYCSVSVAYCILNGQAMAEIFSKASDALGFWQLIQFVFAIALCMFIIIFKETRRRPYWYSIPALLFFTAYLYDLIVDLLYPCC